MTVYPDPYHQEKLSKLAGALATALRPPTRTLDLVQWSDRFRMLPETSAMPGPFVTSRVPQAVPIYEAIHDTEEVVVVAPTQMLKTELLINVALYYCVHLPSSVLLLTVDDDLKEEIKDRIYDAMDASPAIERQRKLTGQKRREARPPEIRFINGSIIRVKNIHGRSATISTAARVVLIDEVDAILRPAEIARARDRAQTYKSRGRIVLVSSPSSLQDSKIWDEFERGTAERWHIICPKCKQLQEPAIVQAMSVSGGGIVYRCVLCDHGMDNAQWARAVDGGEYVAKYKHATKRTFHIHGLTNPLKKLSDVVSEYWRLRSDYELGKDKQYAYLNFRSSRLAEPFDSRVLAEIPVKKVQAMRAKYTASEMPDAILTLTMAVDTQDDRLEYEIAGWGYCLKRNTYKRWGLEYGRLPGVPNRGAQVWHDLAAKYFYTIDNVPFIRRDGTAMAPALMLIDSAGHFTKDVYYFASAHRNKNIWACKTLWRLDQVSRESKVRVPDQELETTPFYLVAANSTKHKIFTIMLSPITPDRPALWVWPTGKAGTDAGYDDKYFKGLCSERRIPKRLSGHGGIIETFDKISASDANEPIDIAMLGFEAIQFVGENSLRAAELRRQKEND